MRAIGMIATVMMVSGLRVMWRMVRPSRTAVSPKKCVVIVGPAQQDGGVAEEMRGHRCSLVVRTVVASRAAGTVVAGDGEEDVLQGRLFLDVLDLGRREELFQFGKSAVRAMSGPA